MINFNWKCLICTAALAVLPLTSWSHGDENDAHDISETTRSVGGANEAQDEVTMDPAERERAREYFTDSTVLDQDGRELKFFSDVLAGRQVLIDFIFTNCDATCPIATGKLNQVRKSLGDRFGEDVFFISISVDPERDDPAALKAYASKHDADVPGWLFLTGEPEDVRTIIKRFGQSTDKVEQHSSLMIAGDVARKHWVKLPPYMSVPQIVMKVDQLGTLQGAGG